MIRRMGLVITKCLSIISQVSHQPEKLFIVVHTTYPVIKISSSLTCLLKMQR